MFVSNNLKNSDGSNNSNNSDKMYKSNNSKEVKSLHSIGSHKERKYDTIPFRLDFIKDLLDGKRL